MQDSCDAKSGQLLEHIFRSRDVVPMSQGLKLRNINFTIFTAQATVMKLEGLISTLFKPFNSCESQLTILKPVFNSSSSHLTLVQPFFTHVV
jgi:hypothetical protein